jgi:hypothetical protein
MRRKRESGRIPSRQAFFECGSGRSSPLSRGRWVDAHHLVNVGWKRDAHRRHAHRQRYTLATVTDDQLRRSTHVHSIRPQRRHDRYARYRFPIGERPFHDEAIGPQPDVQRTPAVRVHVAHVLDRGRTKSIEIEMSIPRHQRIVRPLHGLHAERQAVRSLKGLESPTDPLITHRWVNGEHVGPVDQPIALRPGQAEHKAAQCARCIEGTGGHSADALRHFEDRGTHEHCTIRPPRCLLHRVHRRVVIGRCAQSDRECVGGVYRSGCRRHSGKRVRVTFRPPPITCCSS